MYSAPGINSGSGIILIDFTDVQCHRWKFCIIQWILDDGYCSREVKARIAMALGVFKGNTPFFKENVPLSLKKRLVKCKVWSVLLYSSEVWTLRRAEQQKTRGLWNVGVEKSGWRELERSSYKEEVLMTVEERRKLLNTIKGRKGKWIGHILHHESLPKRVIDGRVKGKDLGVGGELQSSTTSRRVILMLLWKDWLKIDEREGSDMLYHEGPAVWSRTPFSSSQWIRSSCFTKMVSLVACFQNGLWVAPVGTLWVDHLYLTSRSESDEGESTKWRKNWELKPGHLI